MRASVQWLEQLTGLSLDVDDVAEKLTSAGIEVEGIERFGEGLDGVVVAEVRGARPHPARDRLRLVTVFDGVGEQEVVCGAPNVPEPGARVLLARLGAVLPGGMKIEERELGGVVSRGMLCSEVELGLGEETGGIVVLDAGEPGPPGAAVVETFALRDTVLELGITPNRPDCLGHAGLARELCALLGAPLPDLRAQAERLVETSPLASGAQRWSLSSLTGAVHTRSDVDLGGVESVSVDIQDPARCPRYGAALVFDVRVAASPLAVRHRLHVLGLRPINNVVDATNLILLGFGHPIHAFDLDRLRGHRIVVRRAEDAEQLTTLDGVSHRLCDDDLLICDGEGPVALAGVMGGLDSEIKPQTRRVLIECAYFEPRGVRRTSRRLGLHTDSSYRFERGVDPNAVPHVLAHAAALIGNLAGGVVAGEGIDAYPRPIEPVVVPLRRARIEGLLGAAPEPEVAEAILERLGFEVSSTRDGWKVRVPTFRPDVSRETDLIEEVARVHGYDHIPSALPPLGAGARHDAPLVSFVRRLREHAALAGLHEAINYAFVGRRELQAARVDADAVRLVNPLSEERDVLRTSLLPGLAANLRRAQRHQAKDAMLFEVARVFTPGQGAQPVERYRCDLILSGARNLWVGDHAPVDFFDGKGVLEHMLRPLVGTSVATVVGDDPSVAVPYLHPRRCAQLRVLDIPVGVLGELHPEVVEALDLEGRPVYASLDVEALHRVAERVPTPQAQQPPRFPAVSRDVAVVVEESEPAGSVADVLRSAGGSLVEEVALFDIYRGQPVPEQHKSLAFRVVYRDRDATLTDKQVDKAHARVLSATQERFGASLR